jgi:hypothetical protein
MSELAAKDPDVAAEYDIDFHDELVTEAPRRQWLDLDTVVFYPQVDGWYFQVTTAGRTGTNYPSAIPRASGETVTDGSVVLLCKHPNDASVALINSADWTVPLGITKDSQRQVRARAFATFSGGTDGVDYDVLCRITPSAGPPIERTITIPVRAQ